MTTSESGTRRAARRAKLLARRGRLVRAGALGGALAVIVSMVVALVISLPAVSARPPSGGAVTDGAERGGVVVQPAPDPPPVVASLPVPELAVSRSICEDPVVQAALAAGDDEGVVVAAGGGAAFRAAVASGAAPCISLSDPARRWVVVNKARPLEPLDSTPTPLVPLEQTRSLSGGYLRADAAAALEALHAGVQSAGLGEIAMLSGYRSYNTQVSTYSQHVANEGQDAADRSSARPGHSEHQTGITLDLVACNSGCGGLEDFGGSAQGAWVAEHAWEYGFIIRYEDGASEVTGYMPEPWHLRFVGPELARAYAEGGWRTLEEFFGLEPAPDYLG